jgi:hypothetical protein
VRAKALVEAFTSANNESEAARRSKFRRLRLDIEEMRANRTTAAAAVASPQPANARSVALIEARLRRDDSDLASLPGSDEPTKRRSVHMDTNAVAAAAGSAAACAAEAGAPPQVFSTFNLGGAGPTSGTARAAHNTLRTLWDTSGGPMLEVHESAPTSSRKAAAARNTKQQHEHQVLSPHA